MNKMRKSNKPQRGIPRHTAYECGIAPAKYDLEHLIMAFGADNVITMVKELNRGNSRGIEKMLKKWTLHKHGDKFSMIDEMCDTDTKFGLTAATANTHSAGV